MKFYYPYPSDKANKKYFIITNEGKRVYFGASGYEDYTQHKDPLRKIRYIQRHQKNEDWGKSGINTSGFYSRWLLWEEPTLELAYKKLKEKLKGWNII